MKQTIKLSIIYLLLLISNTHISAQTSDNFKIIFNAGLESSQNINLLNRIKQNWGATGINICVNWGDIEKTKNQFDWTALDAAINSVRNDTLEIYLRVSMGVKKPLWIAPSISELTIQDFQINHNGEIYTYNTIESQKYPLNVGSEKSTSYMLRFYSNLIQHINLYYPNIVKEIVPTISAADEMEFPHGEMCGYSQPEIYKFRRFLQNKYGSIEKLKICWSAGSEIQDTSSINPRNYDWQNNISSYYPAGRVDWINWRTSLLKSFIDSCVVVTKRINNNLKVGLQLGSIYDCLIDKRGWYDVTPLIENVDALHVADIIDYKPDFDFAADYARSVCNYWGKIKGKTINFSTESNWPGYGAGKFSVSDLNFGWIAQLSTYYQKGASAHYIYGWDVVNFNDMETDYSSWRDALNAHRNSQRNIILYSKVVHLGCEEGSFLGLAGIATGNYVTSFFKNSIVPIGDYVTNTKNYDGHCDIVTNFMLSNYPTYLQEKNYQQLYLTQSSKYISDQAYKNLMRNDLTVTIENATWFSKNNLGQFAVTSGLKNEYNNYRSPIHLIWRTRNDMMLLFPNANYPDPVRAAQIGWNPATKYDFIFWASNFGIFEYPNWVFYSIYIPQAKPQILYYNYDSNINNVWNFRIDLENVFLDGHYSSDHSWNMIEWVTKYGYKEHPDYLAGYQYWPYIGTPTQTLLKSKSINNSSTNKDNNLNLLSYLNIYPNPVHKGDNLIVNENLSREDINLAIFNIAGKLVYTTKLKPLQTEYINTQNMVRGVYILKINDTEIRKIIIE